MNSTRILYLFAATFILSACGNLRIKAYQPYQAPADAKSVVLTGFYFAPPVLPKNAAGDAEVFNKKVWAKAEAINRLLSENSNSNYDLLARGIELQMNLDVLYGDALATKPNYARLKKKEDLDNLKVGKSRAFPSMFLSEKGLHLFDLEKGDIKAYLEESPRLRSAVKSACKAGSAELMAFAYGRLVIDKVTRFGEKANLRLEVDIYLYTEKAELAGHAYGETVPIIFDASSESDFQNVLDMYATLQAEILTELTKVEEEDIDE
jgi:hypothetical protein